MPLSIESTIVVPATAPAKHLHRILAVDDDEHFREMLCCELAEHGFVVEAFADSRTFLQSLVADEEADLILLDWSLPQGCGLDILTQIRRLGVTLPVIFLTGRALTSNEMLAFDRGAVDFIDKARGIPVLVRRLRSIITSSRHTPPLEEKFVDVGCLRLKLQASRVLWKGHDLAFTLGEFKIVNLLASRAGRYVTYREIYDCLRYRGFIGGNGEYGYRTNVRSAIKRIRGKFRAADPTFTAIQNFTSFGYVWKATDGD